MPIIASLELILDHGVTLLAILHERANQIRSIASYPALTRFEGQLDTERLRQLSQVRALGKPGGEITRLVVPAVTNRSRAGFVRAHILIS